MANKPFLWRFVLALTVTVIAVVFLVKTIEWHKVDDETKRQIFTPQEYAKKYKSVIKLGLDLQGGIHLVLGADMSEVTPEERRDIVDRIITVIRTRIDESGVAEPVIRKEGNTKIVVELPGMKDPERAIELVTQTAYLEFKLVDEAYQSKADSFIDEDGKVKESLPLPPNDELLFMERVNTDTKEKEKIPMLLKKTALLTGDELKSAKVDFGRFGEPVVSLEMKPRGTRIFARITEENVGKRLAIILNGNVISAPNIKEKIPSGKAYIEGSFTLQEAKDLALVLRAGALPAPVQILENQTVGPTLGKDSIEKGKTAFIIGILLVFLVMLVYYKFAGFLADITILLEMLIILGAMSLFNFTLTFPGIAGLVLTIGMAVDANILIFERIREELVKGNSNVAAVHRGFEKAFITILDSNLTTLVAAAVLFKFGTGPLKGFAVTLSIGILASMFGALIITRMFYEYLLGTVHVKKLSI